MTIIRVPRLRLRDYQRRVHEAFFEEGIKRILLTLHRRAGKDACALSLMSTAALKDKGTYFYLFPQQNQVRKAIWDNIGKDGNKFLDEFPKEAIEKINNSEMKINLKSGSIIQMCGSDNYDAIMGTNPRGVVLSEYSLQTPYAWDYIRPILAENGGWALFTQTPRGKNHGYTLHKNTVNDSNWLNMLLTIDDTKDIYGNPIITQEAIEQERKSGMPEELIRQEFYCDFDAAIANAIYAEQISQAYADKRICDFPIDPRVPVYTFWDIGTSDYTAIWFMQPIGEELHFIAYYQNNRKGIDFYLDKINEISTKYGFYLSRDHWGPHDMAKQDFSSGTSAYWQASRRNLNFQIVPAINVIFGISRVRALFPRVWIHANNCAEGIEALKNYQSEFVEKDRIYKKVPRHDWASHGADAFRTFGNAWKDNMTENDFFKKKVIKTKNWL